MSVSLAMVALGPNARISRAAIQERWAAHWPDGPLATDVEKKDGVLSFRVSKCHVACGLIPSPIPWSDLEGPCARNRNWPEAASTMRSQAAHVIVTAIGNVDAVERMVILTQATCVLLESCTNAIGVYWCSSLLVLPPNALCEFATDYLPDRLPLPLWIDIRMKKAAGGKIAALTTGLSALEQMELETTDCRESPRELRARLLGLAEYLLQHGPVIKDGDTFGEDVNEQIKIRYSRSAFGRDEAVMRLHFGVTRAGSSRMTAYGYVHAFVTLLLTVGFGAALHVAFPEFLRGNLLRYVVLLAVTVFFGFVLLLMSDRFLQKTFGLEAFAEDITSDA